MPQTNGPQAAPAPPRTGIPTPKSSAGRSSLPTSTLTPSPSTSRIAQPPRLRAGVAVRPSIRPPTQTPTRPSASASASPTATRPSQPQPKPSSGPSTPPRIASPARQPSRNRSIPHLRESNAGLAPVEPALPPPPAVPSSAPPAAPAQAVAPPPKPPRDARRERRPLEEGVTTIRAAHPPETEHVSRVQAFQLTLGIECAQFN